MVPVNDKPCTLINIAMGKRKIAIFALLLYCLCIAPFPAKEGDHIAISNKSITLQKFQKQREKFHSLRCIPSEEPYVLIVHYGSRFDVTHFFPLSDLQVSDGHFSYNQGLTSYDGFSIYVSLSTSENHPQKKQWRIRAGAETFLIDNWDDDGSDDQIIHRGENWCVKLLRYQFVHPEETNN